MKNLKTKTKFIDAFKKAGENKIKLLSLQTKVRNQTILSTDEEATNLDCFIREVYRKTAAVTAVNSVVSFSELTDKEQEIITAARALTDTDYEVFKKSEYVISILNFLTGASADKRIYQILRFSTGTNMVHSHLDKTFHDLEYYDSILKTVGGSSLIKMFSFSKADKMRIDKNTL